jgi:hypothetical protein
MRAEKESNMTLQQVEKLQKHYQQADKEHKKNVAEFELRKQFVKKFLQLAESLNATESSELSHKDVKYSVRRALKDAWDHLQQYVF